MRASELIKISTNLLKLLSKYDIKTEDVKYVELYTDYESQMRQKRCCHRLGRSIVEYG